MAVTPYLSGLSTTTEW